MFKTISIIGLGLIGGSLAKAVKKHKLAKIVIGYAPNQNTLHRGLASKAIDTATDNIDSAIKETDAVFICAPLRAYGEIFTEILQKLGLGQESTKTDIIISDVGSVKSCFAEVARAIRNFVPAHPIAGSEKTGFDASQDSLFEGRKLIITPDKNVTDKIAIRKISEFWQRIGADVEEMDANKHDKIYAFVSHLPQLLAFAFADLMSEEKFDYTDAGFTKFTRICGSDIKLWQDIFQFNSTNISIALEKYEEKLEKTLPLNTGVNASMEVHQIIAKALVEITPDEYKKYAGSGFNDFTACVEKAFASKESSSRTVELLNKFKLKLKDKKQLLK